MCKKLFYRIGEGGGVETSSMYVKLWNKKFFNKAVKCRIFARSEAECGHLSRVTMALLTHVTYTQEFSTTAMKNIDYYRTIERRMSILFSIMWGYSRFSVLLLYCRSTATSTITETIQTHPPKHISMRKDDYFAHSRAKSKFGL